MRKLSTFLFAWLLFMPVLSGEFANAQTASDTVRFGFMSDIHYGMTDYNGEKLYQDDWMRKALSGFLRRNAEFIFVGGDIVNASNDATQYAMFDNEMITRLPWYPMAGNHDIGADPAGVTMAKISAWNARGYGRGPNNREYYGFTVKNIGAFYVLNTQAYIATDLTAKARADSQLVEMDRFFTDNESLPVKVVCSHVPLFTVSPAEDSAYFNIGKTYRQRIIDVMNKHNVHYYLAGHRHENAVVTASGITVFANTALSFQLGSGNVRGYYIYTLTKDGLKRDFYPLASEPAANKWKWIAYGDTRTNDAAHRSVLASIKSHTPDYRFILNVGDCVEDGTNQSLWDIWQKAINDVLGGSGQQNHPPRYMAVPGNHEAMTMPGAVAAWKYNLPGQQQFGNDGRFFYFDHENARIIMMDAFGAYSGAQMTLLNDAIRTNQKQWLFVVWHQPIFSYGDKAYVDSLNQMWAKPLGQAGCDVIFTGHAHYYVRTYKLRLNGDRLPAIDPVAGTVHIVTGDGGAPLRPTVTNYDNNEYSIAYRYDKNQAGYYGYCELDMDGDTMVLRHYNGTGALMDSVVLKANQKGTKYKITRSLIGQGSIVVDPADSIFAQGTVLGLKAVPALGWQFVKWSGAKSGTTNPDTMLVQGNATVSAEFQAIDSNLLDVRTDAASGGIVVRDPVGPYYAPGTKVTFTAVPNAGMKFTGWTGDTTASAPVLTFTATKHMSITAGFRPIESYKLNSRPSSLGSITFTPSGGTYQEGTPVQVKATPGTGWEFYAWAGDLNGARNPDTVLVDKAKELRAIYKKTGTNLYELPATEDTYIRGGITYQAKNFNADSCLLVREGTSTLNQARTYIKFDVSSVQGKVLAAWLKLHVRQTGLPEGAPAKATAFPVTDDSWSELLLKWTGAPTAGTILDSAVAVSTMGNDYAIDVTSHVTAKMAGNKIVSVIVKDPTVSDKPVQFEKREGTSAPTLVVVTDQPTGVAAGEAAMPTEYRLYQNYPNPFNPSTLVTFTVPKKEHVEIKVFDMLGREVAVLQSGVLEAGRYERVWNASNRSSGIYLCRMTTSAKNEIIRMTLLK